MVKYVVVKDTSNPKRKRKTTKNKKVNNFVQSLKNKKPKKARPRLIGLGLFVLGFIISGVAPGLASFIAWAGLLLMIVFTIKKVWGQGHTWMSVLAWIMCGVLALICLFMMYQSAHIYSDLFSSASAPQEAIEWGDLGASNASQIWLIGPLFSAFLRFIARLLQDLELSLLGITGVLIYLIIQTFEVLPLIFDLFPSAKRKAIEQLRRFDTVTINNSDSEWTAKLADSYNNRYENFFTRLYYGMFIAYAVDLIVCLIKASPLKGGWQVWPEIEFLFWQNIPQYLDWENIFRIFATVMFFTIVFLLMIQAKQAGYIFSNADE